MYQYAAKAGLILAATALCVSVVVGGPPLRMRPITLNNSPSVATIPLPIGKTPQQDVERNRSRGIQPAHFEERRSSPRTRFAGGQIKQVSTNPAMSNVVGEPELWPHAPNAGGVAREIPTTIQADPPSNDRQRLSIPSSLHGNPRGQANHGTQHAQSNLNYQGQLTAHQTGPALAPKPSLAGSQNRRAPSMIAQHQQRELSPNAVPAGQAAGVAKTDSPWWEAHVRQSFRPGIQPIGINLDMVLVEALGHSERIQAIRTGPAIQETFIPEADAEFDWRAFLESRFDDTSDPVGNTLTTGGASRFRDHRVTSRGGVRRKNIEGGEFEISQQVGYQDNNSNFFVPKQQGTAKLVLSYTQPLMNGAGQEYNTSRVVLANLETEAASFEEMERIRDHLAAVTRAYWEIYLARVVLLQKWQLHSAGETILQTLEARRTLDAAQSQISRAQAAVASRRADIKRAEANLLIAETQLRRLVNAQSLQSSETAELLPEEIPQIHPWMTDPASSRALALENRAEFQRALKKIHSAGVRAGVARHELLPLLDVVLGAYVSGLDGETDIAQAYTNQFSVGQPSYSVGLVFEVPLGNRAAKARLQRRKLEWTRAMHEYNDTVESGLAEVEIALREIEAGYDEMMNRHQSMSAAYTELWYLTERWEHGPRNDQVAPLLLEQLLDAQDRLGREENDFASAQVGYLLAILEWKRSTGTLMQYSIPNANEGIPMDFPPSNGQEMPEAEIYQPNAYPLPATR